MHNGNYSNKMPTPWHIYNRANDIPLTRASLENDTQKEVQFCPRAKGPRAELDFLRTFWLTFWFFYWTSLIAVQTIKNEFTVYRVQYMYSTYWTNKNIGISGRRHKSGTSFPPASKTCWWLNYRNVLLPPPLSNFDWIFWIRTRKFHQFSLRLGV